LCAAVELALHDLQGCCARAWRVRCCGRGHEAAAAASGADDDDDGDGGGGWAARAAVQLTHPYLCSHVTEFRFELFQWVGGPEAV
jgi:hypothetical protein